MQPYSLITLRNRPLSPAAQTVYEVIRKQALRNSQARTLAETSARHGAEVGSSIVNSAPPVGEVRGVDRAAVLPNDGEADPEAEAGALADGLGGEEWLEDLAQILGRDPHAIVADDDLGCARLAHERNLDAPVRPVLDRIERIVDQIDHDLMDLALVAFEIEVGANCRP